jgi:cytosine/adenosine deaminase-related metal-dependent hydrolase
LIRYRAAWVVPVARPPVRHGWVAIDRGRVAAVGQGDTGDGMPEQDLGAAAIMPGLVNAHTHLELSYLRGAIPAAADFVTWIRGVVAARRQEPDPGSPAILNGIREGISECLRTGTVLVGDISNTLVTVDALEQASLSGVVFHELLGFNAPDPDDLVAQACARVARPATTPDVRVSLAAHAPYSVAPQMLRAIAREARSRGLSPVSVHLSESREEVEFVASGTGSWRSFLDDVGAWNPAWPVPGTTPVEYLNAEGFLGPDVIAVHGVQMTDADLEILRSSGTTLVTCPRSNRHTGAGNPPVERFFNAGVRMAVGTDSLASTADLNLFAELAMLRTLAPRVEASRLIESATRDGARALGFEQQFGTIEPGKSGRLLAISMPAAGGDVEEYLVGGVQPAQIGWIAP